MRALVSVCATTLSVAGPKQNGQPFGACCGVPLYWKQKQQIILLQIKTEMFKDMSSALKQMPNLTEGD